MTPIHLKPRVGTDPLTARLRDVSAPMIECRDVVTRALSALREDLTNRRPTAELATSVRLRRSDAALEAALAALDELEATVRPAVVEMRRRNAVLADEVEAEEQRLAAEADAERQRARTEATVARRVAEAEAERLRSIEDDVRAELAGAAGGR